MVTVPSGATETKAESCPAAALFPPTAFLALGGRGIRTSSASPPPASNDALSMVRRSRRATSRDMAAFLIGRACGNADGAANPVVAAAAAQVAGHRRVDLRDAWLRGLREQRAGRHDLPGLAVTALHDIDFEPRRLQ